MAPVPKLSDPASLNDMLLARVAMLVGTAGSLVKRLCEDHFGITRREWGVLAWVASHPGAPTSSEVAARSHIDRTRTSRSISSLVAKKLLAREGHRDRTVLVLTPAGRAMYDSILPHTHAIQRELLSSLDGPDDVAHLARMLGALQTCADRLVADQAAAKKASASATTSSGRSSGR